MNRSATRLVLAALAATLVPEAAQSDDAAKARTIIKRAIDAIGGPEILQKHTRVEIEDQGTYHGMGQGVPYKGRFAFHWPGKYRMEIVDAFVIVSDGEKGWFSMMGNTSEITGDPLKYQHQEIEAGYINSLIPFAKPKSKYELSLFGAEEVDGEACDGVNVKRGDRPTVTILFSRKTGLMKKFQTSVHSAEKNYAEVVEASVYSDYRKVDGVLVPMKTTVTRDGEKFVESEITSVQFPDSFDDSMFAKP